MGIRKYKTGKGQTRYGVNVYEKRTGKTHWVGTFKNADDAKIAFAEADRRFRLGALIPEQRDIGFDALVQLYLERSAVATETKDEYRRTLAHAIAVWGGRTARSITKEDMEDLVAGKNAEGMHPGQVRKLATRISQVMNAAIDWGYLSSSPTTGRIRSLPPAPSSVVRPLAQEEVRALIEATAPYWRTAVLAFVACGLRRSELFGLLVSDVDFEAGTITVRGQLKNGQVERTKTPAGVRVVAIPEVLIAALEVHITNVPETELGLLFPTERGRPVTPSNWYRRVWRPAVDASGVRADLKLHDLRRQFASVLVRQGRSAAYLQAVMGHRSPSTTLKWYVGKFDDEAEQATKDMNQWLVEERPIAYVA